VIARDMQRAGAGLRSIAEPVVDTTLRFCRACPCHAWRRGKARTPAHCRAHGAGPGRRQGERRQIRPQADPHPTPAERGPQAPRSWRDATRRRAELQCQSGDDFETLGVVLVNWGYRVRRR